MDRKKVFELDKICRVCMSERKEMRPLFSEKVAEMLMDCTNVHVEPIKGWPDKICVQCVHSVSRNYAFKTLVERCDKELREYIQGLTKALDSSQSSSKSQICIQQKQKKLLQKQIKEKQQEIGEQQQKLQMQQDMLPQHQQLAQSVLVLQKPQQQQEQLKQKLRPLAKKMPCLAKKNFEEPEPQQVISLQQQRQQITTQITSAAQQLSLPPQHPQHTLQSTQQLLPATTTLPQQILLPNGQIITTAQILTHTGGTPQLAQIISTAPQTTVTGTPGAATGTTTISAPQGQYLPQLLQAPNGQTLQILQQPNGAQTFQLVQLLPQRNLTNSSSTNMTNTMLTADTDVQLIDDSNVEEDLNEAYDELDNKESIETIVLEDDQSQHHQQHIQQNLMKEGQQMIDEEDLTQSDAQELFFEDMNSTTSQQLADDEMPEQLLHNDCEEDDDEGGFIIEELQMDDEIVEDDADDSVIHVMDTNGVTNLSGNEDCEYITDDNHHNSVHHLGDSDDIDEVDYTILDTTVEDADVENAIIESDDILEPTNTLKNAAIVEYANSEMYASPTPSKKFKRNNNSNANNNNSKMNTANSRQLAVTASVIAAVGGDDNCEIDAKLVTEFIRQQTSPIGSGRYICNLCNTEFRQFKGLQNHMQSHTNWIRANCKKQPQCSICLKSFKGPGMLRMHMKTHDSESVAPTCNVCNKTFKSKAILYRHRQTHQQRAFSCGVSNCRKTFSNAINLRGHIERKHPGSTMPVYKCGECHTLYEDVDSLQSHVELTGHGATSNPTATQDISCDISSVVSGASSISANGTETAVVMGSTGEMFFVTQA